MTATGKPKLTDFQVRLLGQACPLMMVTFDCVTIRSQGESELFLLIEAEGCSVYIYEDAFDVKSAGGFIRFEKDDIVSLDHGLSEFVKAIELLSEKA